MKLRPQNSSHSSLDCADPRAPFHSDDIRVDIERNVRRKKKNEYLSIDENVQGKTKLKILVKMEIFLQSFEDLNFKSLFEIFSNDLNEYYKPEDN